MGKTQAFSAMDPGLIPGWETNVSWVMEQKGKKKGREEGKGNTCYATTLKKSQNNYAEGNQPDKRLHTV